MSEASADSDRSLPGSAADELSETENIDEADLEEDEDEEDSDSSGEDGNGYFDLEAAESDDDIGDGMSPNSDDGPVYFFPQFSRLPIELRTRIWEFLDPDMRAPARVFDFMLQTGLQTDAWESACLDEQTAPARAVLATHRESRALALRFYPDEARFHKGHGLVRCRKETDIFLIHGSKYPASDSDWAAQLPLLEGVRHLAFGTLFNIHGAMSDKHPLFRVDSGAYPIFTSLPDLDALYYCEETDWQPAKSLAWCASDSARKFHVRTHEEGESGVGEAEVDYLYCWLHPTKDRASIEEKIPDMPAPSHSNAPFKLASGREIWPMVEFLFNGGMRRYDRICQAYAAEGDWDDNYSSPSHHSSDSSSEENEYESDGIDDGTIDGSESGSNDDDDMVLQESSQQEDVSAFGGFSPMEGEPGSLPVDHDLMAANFSSLEPESPSADDTDPSVAGGQSIRAAQRPKRRVVTDSEEESDSTGVQEDTRTAVRRPRAILSDSEDGSVEVEEVVRPPGRRARVILSDSEDDDDDDEADVGSKSGGAVVSLGDEVDSAQPSESDGDEDESSGTEPETRKLSLAERLQLFRSENPVAGSGLDSDPDADEMGTDDGDDAAEDLTHFPDDEDGEDQSGNDVGLDLAEDEFDNDEEEW